MSLQLRNIRITEYTISSKVYRDRIRKEEKKRGGVGKEGGGGWMLLALNGMYNTVFIAYLTIAGRAASVDINFR